MPIPIDYSKILAPEQQAALAATVDKFGRPAPEPSPQSPKLSVPMDTQLQTPGLAPAAPLASPEYTKGERTANFLNRQAEEQQAAFRSQLQDMFNARRRELEKQRTDDLKLAAFNSLGNALRTMVQPIGWAAGGATAGVQPYDERQYINAFNRAVKAGEDLRNLGMEETKYGLDYARRAEERALREYDFQRRRNESNADYFARLDAQAKATAARNVTDMTQKRWDMVIRAWMQENNSNVRKGQKVIDLSEYLQRLGNIKDTWLGGSTLSVDDINAIGEEAVASANGSATPVATPETQPVATPTEQPTDKPADKPADKPTAETSTKKEIKTDVKTKAGAPKKGRAISRIKAAKEAGQAAYGQYVRGDSAQPAAESAVSAQDAAAQKWGGKRKK